MTYVHGALYSYNCVVPVVLIWADSLVFSQPYRDSARIGCRQGSVSREAGRSYGYSDSCFTRPLLQ
jgi:hypothetical protein